jgi:hypothetical protein
MTETVSQANIDANFIAKGVTNAKPNSEVTGYIRSDHLYFFRPETAEVLVCGKGHHLIQRALVLALAEVQGLVEAFDEVGGPFL